MSVNKNIDSNEYKQTLKSVFPTQFEPGSLADRLLIQGREEGRQEGRDEGRQEGRDEGIVAGKIQLLQELLGERISGKEELAMQPLHELETRLSQLQKQLRDRDA